MTRKWCSLAARLCGSLENEDALWRENRMQGGHRERGLGATGREESSAGRKVQGKTEASVVKFDLTGGCQWGGY